MKKLVLLFVCLFLCVNTAFAKGNNIDINYDNGIYHIVLKGEKIKKKIKVYASETLKTNKEIHKAANALLTINAGFFDPSNGKTISYVVMDGQTMEDPIMNENLLTNTFLNKNLNKILNRTEFRVVDCYGKLKYEIVPHNTKEDFECYVKEAVQGGPLILPELRLEEELFVVKDGDKIVRESSSVLHKTSRTVLGLKNGELHILIITDENPMDMYEVQKLCKKLGFERAMGLDGGSSTSFDYKNEISVISKKGDGAGRELKSFIYIKK